MPPKKIRHPLVKHSFSSWKPRIFLQDCTEHAICDPRKVGTKSPLWCQPLLGSHGSLVKVWGFESFHPRSWADNFGISKFLRLSEAFFFGFWSVFQKQDIIIPFHSGSPSFSVITVNKEFCEIWLDAFWYYIILRLWQYYDPLKSLTVFDFDQPFQWLQTISTPEAWLCSCYFPQTPMLCLMACVWDTAMVLLSPREPVSKLNWKEDRQDPSPVGRGWSESWNIERSRTTKHIGSNRNHPRIVFLLAFHALGERGDCMSSKYM